MTSKSDGKKATAETQLRSFIDRFEPKAQKLFRSVRAALRKRFPAANELAYDYNHSVVIAYSASDRGIESILSISLLADGVRLYFMHGPRLPDPKGLLQGSAKQVRFVQLKSASELAHADVKALIAAAVELATVPLPSKGKGSLVIKSAAAKKRPRRKTKK
jgi:hypothetical protein